jgi:hypothetical protein
MTKRASRDQTPSQDNVTDLRARKIGYVMSLPPSDHPDLLALPDQDRTVVDPWSIRGRSGPLPGSPSPG